MRGTNSEFETILKSLVDVTKKWEAKQINHIRFAEHLDGLFGGSYNWSREAFYAELNSRLGKHTNEPKNKQPAKKSAKKA